MKKVLCYLAIAFFFFIPRGVAQDFFALNDDGKRIYYNITSNEEPYTVAVTNSLGGPWDVANSAYSGVINIPSYIRRNNITYQVTSIEGNAFRTAFYLTHIYLPDGITTIHPNSFADCDDLIEARIPNSVTRIGDRAFYFCRSLTDIDIPGSVNVIGNCAFQWCGELPKVSIPYNISDLQHFSFASCCSLEKITIPNGVARINESAFSGCNGHSSVVALPQIPPSFYMDQEQQDFPNPIRDTLFVPIGSVNAYETAYLWNTYETIIGIQDHQLFFDANGGTLTDTIPFTILEDFSIDRLPIPSFPGHELLGWTIGDSSITNDFVWYFEGDTTATAQWVPKQYLLSFNSNGGTNVTDTIWATYNDAIGTLPTTARTGYTFSGWKIADETISETTPWQYTMYRTATAQWTANEYELTLDPNGGELSTNTITVSIDNPIGPLPTPTRGYFTFDGWFIDDNPINDSTIWQYLSDATAIARWIPNYMLSFDINYDGGENPEAIIIPENHPIGMLPQPTREGYTLSGWIIGEDLINDNTIWQYTTDTTATAIWLRNYLLSFDINYEGGENIEATTTVETLPIGDLPLPTREGYTLAAWLVGEDEITAETIWNYNTDTTATALWAQNFTLSFNCNFDNGTNPNPITVSEGLPIVNLPTPYRLGYTFTGWYVNEEPIANGTLWAYNENLTAIAQWEASSYHLILYPNQGEVAIDTLTVTYLDAIGELPIPTRTGYAFVEWIIDGETIIAETVWDYANHKTAIAIWESLPYTLFFDLNYEVANAPEEHIVTYNLPLGSLPSAARIGYTFSGWFIGDEEITENTIWTFTCDTTAVAQWQAKTYELSFDPWPSSSDVPLLQVTYDEPIDTLPTAEREGHSLAGWFIDGIQITEETIWNYTEPKIAFAQWERNQYNLTLIINDETENSVTLETYYNESIGQLPIPSWQDHVFLGWYMDGSEITAETLWIYEEDKEAYAHWEDHSSIAENEIHRFKIYPNPATHWINIEGNEIEKVDIYDFSGRFILSEKNQSQINVENLEQGIYFARITTVEGVVSLRFIKQ